MATITFGRGWWFGPIRMRTARELSRRAAVVEARIGAPGNADDPRWLRRRVERLRRAAARRERAAVEKRLERRKARRLGARHERRVRCATPA
jgi:hypothetical protein